MTLEIEITPELEQQLQQAAEKAGVTPDAYIVRLLQQNLKPTHSLPENEVELLQRIDRSLSHIEWQRYSDLLSKRDAQTLTPTEHNELIAVSEQIELANAHRIEALGELSRIRNTSINDLIAELGLGQIVYA
ncbi:hypothetical protein [Iningainema tapete]|uniref:Uncharacterized protein n=1 Tax=Iningainema tapete BLCC-T55 TaxID=2748662 RepID=A0A8J6XF95_9CYAN|nr:hypothetical protein [Iningainema tapete]MBD2771266.1 hypothetical protein [Iningainema tapete BLCC-T55]